MSGHGVARRRLVRAGARGLVAAMAMTGVRTLMGALAPHEKSPPQAIVDEHAPAAVSRLPERRRAALTELAHWTYGTGGGVAFGVLPRRVREHPAAGPAYGLGVWLAFELVLAPALGIQHARHRQVAWRAAIAVDHVLYGVVVADRLAPEPPGRR
ncbi:MAG: hypothetical protein ACRDYU_06805 [Actinomycetes bacterium]